MYCYKCGCLLSDKDFCTACGAEVGRYKKIVYVSNRLYNDGLEKAQVRDLTGAVNSLRQSLKIYKHNIDARNLLGLVYFEMGEAVLALKEWVISKNLRSEKNVADDYIGMMQPNMGQLDNLRQTIKKYNQAYTYCKQDSQDLAIIQLKKVLSLNPKFVRAHLLLALLYMNSDQWEKAQREVARCLDIDKNNTMALRYQREIETVLAPDDSAVKSGKGKKGEAVRYQNDNELIIQPVSFKEQRGGGGHAFLNIFAGLLTGLLVMYFLVLPARISSVRNEANQETARISEQSDAKNATIKDLESQMEELNEEIEKLKLTIQGYEGEGGTLSILDNLFDVAKEYLKTKNYAQTGESLRKISEKTDMEKMSKSFVDLYQALLREIGPSLSQDYYTEGYTAYRIGDYDTAIVQFGMAVYYDETNVDALYNLADSYRNINDTENALLNFEKVAELFPGTNQARRALQQVTALSAQDN